MSGVVRTATEIWWNKLKKAHFIDVQTRSVIFTISVRSNNLGVKNRARFILETVGSGYVFPSYDIETRVESTNNWRTTKIFMHIALAIVLHFMFLEGVELYDVGASEYFMDMWNVMDWLNFILYFVVWVYAMNLKSQLENPSCGEICSNIGYHDDWGVFNTAKKIKTMMSVCVCIQMLKIIKFMNMLIPKTVLAVSVLRAVLLDLLFFGIVFLVTLVAFSEMFFVQLGALMPEFNDPLASFISLSRALFGDFDIDAIIDNSNGYLNAVFFISYLFVAVFIMLSIFLTILGEGQGQVRAKIIEAQENGTAPREYGIIADFSDMVAGAVSRCRGQIARSNRVFPWMKSMASLKEGGAAEAVETKENVNFESLLLGMRDELQSIRAELKRSRTEAAEDLRANNRTGDSLFSDGELCSASVSPPASPPMSAMPKYDDVERTPAAVSGLSYHHQRDACS